MNMSPPQYERVIEDCDTALALDLHYVKALNRRATALENLNRNEEALRGVSSFVHTIGVVLMLLQRLHCCHYS